MAQFQRIHRKESAAGKGLAGPSQLASTSTHSAGSSHSHAQMLIQMQRTLGNRAVQAYAAQFMALPRSAQAQVQRNPTPPPAQEEDSDTVEGLSIASDTVSESFGKPADDLKDAYDKSGEESVGHKAASIGAVGNTADMAGGILQIISSIKETLSVSEDTDRTVHNKNWNYAAQGASIVDGAGKTVSGGTGLVDKAAKSSGSLDGVGKSSVASDYTGSVGDAISGVKSAVLAVKGIYDMYSKFSEDGGLSKADTAKGIIEIIGNAIESAQSALKAAKSIMEIMETSTAALTTVIPGVSIAVSGVKIALKTVDAIKAGLNRSAMTVLKRSFKEKHASKGFIKAKRWFGGNAGVDQTKLAAHKRDLELRKSQGDSAAETELQEITQYELAREMKAINVKRTDRASLQIGIELTKIAGDVATLTGVGAQVGTPLKIVAAGVGAAMPAVRTLKQMGRDRAAKPGAWGLTKAVFNAEKSTEKKNEKRGADAQQLMDMIRALPQLDASKPEVVKQYQQAHQFVNAAGVSLFELEKVKNDPDKLKKAWLRLWRKGNRRRAYAA
ncbi:hypothetical protein [Paenibacillus hexagrammi]|uniref:Uncharacterized protein n=1 Tax=Paenibacillus hexagrammi TaxID=2908839 RepID=A0ABY3SJ94_9BACL|nr:hypothetical protein [Paenibacillus sp. YPD9-1]UJF34109.1 hypothetical protein L0M14_02400 [Paenibacillus sp. YPD9-1]